MRLRLILALSLLLAVPAIAVPLLLGSAVPAYADDDSGGSCNGPNCG